MRIEPQPSSPEQYTTYKPERPESPEKASQSYSGQGRLEGQEPFDQLAAVGWGEGNLTLAPSGLGVQGLDLRTEGLGLQI